MKKLDPLVEVFKKSMDSYSEAIVVYFVRCVLPILKKINDMGLQGGSLMQRINDELFRFPADEELI